LSHFRWNILPPLSERQLARASHLPPLIVQFLHNRGLDEPSQFDLFLKADSRLSGDPFRLPDMHQAVGRIYRALLSGDNIVVYGDFDVDGITSTVLLVEGLTELGAKVRPYIPHRLTEGYGLKAPALENLYREGARLIVTCDCGITALPEVKKARKMGLDIIITDHHTPLEELPPAVAVINPKRADSTYPFTELAGVGVALKLIQALFQSLGKKQELNRFLDLVALGTVADIVPLIGENRYLVTQGLQTLNSAPRLGIREMMTQAGLSTGTIDPGRISWVIAPRLNTPGRLEHAMASYQLLTTDSPDDAKELTTWLEQKNKDRQKMTADALSKAREQVVKEGLTPLLFASDEEFPAGINGLVAGRLSEEFYRPAIVVRMGEVWSTGSCRSIPEFNIIQALNRCRPLLSHYGGHARAAGFTLPTCNLWGLKQTLLELAAAELAGVDLRPHLDIEAEVTLAELVSNNTFSLIQKLAPFGEGNPQPTFLSCGVNVLDCRTMGGNGEHIRIKLKQGGCIWDGVGFGLGSYISEITPHVNIVYNLEIDRWNGHETLRLNILDFGAAK
jgi:single-stranded-DNA-specific exonuclease